MSNRVSVNLDKQFQEILESVHRPDLAKMDRNALENTIADWRRRFGSPPINIPCGEIVLTRGPVISQRDLSGVNLHGIDISYSNFNHCNLEGAKISGARADTVQFNNCDLSHLECADANFRCSEFLFCIMRDSGFVKVHFEGAEFNCCDLSKAKLLHCYTDRTTSFSVSVLYRASLDDTDLENVNLSNVHTMHGVSLHGARLEGTNIRYELFGGRTGEELDKSYYFAAKAYLAIKANLEARGYYKDAGRAYIKQRQMERCTNAPWRARMFFGEDELSDEHSNTTENKDIIKSKKQFSMWHPKVWWFYLRHTCNWVASWSVDLLCSYGESAWRVMFWILVLIFIVGPFVFGHIGGLEFSNRNIDTYNSLSDPWRKSVYSYLQYYLYSLDALTTANFSEATPANDLVRMASGFTALIGIFLAGLLGFVIGNRIRHS